MTWLVISTPRGASVEFSRWVSPADRVISEHDSKRDADEALRVYKLREEMDAARAAGQRELELE